MTFTALHSLRLVARATATCRAAACLLCMLVTTAVPVAAFAQADPSMETRINELVPKLETYITDGMKAYDSPGLAIGIVAGDKLVYAKGFGTRTKGGEPVDTRTVFQIGSTTKAFLSTTMAIAVDRGGFKWDDRLIDLDPDFQMKDAWVTREIRMFDIITQRSGMPGSINDTFGRFGFDEATLIRSLRYVDPVTSFRATFAYTNITHLEAGRIVANVLNAADWRDVLQKEIFEPLGMTESSATAAAIEAAANHAVGHRWEPTGTVEVPFTEIFPYDYKGAGGINSTVEDMAHWLRLQLGNGTFEGKRIVSPENLAVTRMARVSMSDKLAYAMGWMLYTTPNGVVVWHNGGTLAFGSHVGFQPDRDIGVIVLTNETNHGFPDAIGFWTFDRLMGNPEVDHVAAALTGAKAGAERDVQLFARPAKSATASRTRPACRQLHQSGLRHGCCEAGGRRSHHGARVRRDVEDRAMGR